MQGVEELIKTSLGEIQRVLDEKTVMGEPIVIEGSTLIPLISVGFGFSAGGVEGKGDSEKKGEGIGGGAGGGAGIKPVALIIIDKDGVVTVEPIKGGLSAALEKLGEKVPQMVEKWQAQKQEGDKKGS